jgi:hypothetical protein
MDWVVMESVSLLAASAETSAGDSGRGEMFRPRAQDPDVWQFLELDHAARSFLLAELTKRTPVRRYAGPAERIDHSLRKIHGATQIVDYARSGRRQAVIEAIASQVELETYVVSACLDDAGGEPAAVLFKALGLDNFQAQQVFLLATPTLGLDVNEFIHLTEIYAGMESWVAEILVSSWQESDAPPAVSIAAIGECATAPAFQKANG